MVKHSTRTRPENSGRPRFTDGEIVHVTLKLSRAQYDYLKATGNLSAEVRRLVDAARALAKGTE